MVMMCWVWGELWFGIWGRKRNPNPLSPLLFHFCSDDADGSQSSRLKIFDRDLKRKQDCKRTFPTTLCLGGSSEAIRRLSRGCGGIENLIMMDMAIDMVKHLKDTYVPSGNIQTSYVVGDEEFFPVKERYGHFTNLVPAYVSNMQAGFGSTIMLIFLSALLHEGAMIQRAKDSMHYCSYDREGGISPRISLWHKYMS